MSGIRGVTGLRTALGTILQSSADIYRKTRAPDVSGGQTDTYAKVSSLPCHFAPAGAFPREREERGVLIQSLAYWTFTFAHNADVRPTDRLVVGTRTFEIQGGGVASLGVFTEVTCLEVR